MRGQAHVLMIVLLAVVTLLFFIAFNPALNKGIDHALPGSDTLQHLLLLTLVPLFAIGALVWFIAFIPGVFSR